LYNTEYLVKFLDGNNKTVYEEWVLEGVAAVDPVGNGIIDIPTKEADA
jgi:hypothetical protein